jgi:hypothetical protein
MNSEKIWYPNKFKEGADKEIVSLMESDIQLRGSQAVFSLDLWNWKYKKNNAGFFPNWILLARSRQDNSIGGHYTAIPVKILAKDKVLLAAQSVDTITHIDFRKQGIFTGLAELCYKEMEKDGIDIIIGYPNDNSFPGFVKKLNWKHIFTVEEVGYVINTKKIALLKFNNTFKSFLLNYALIIRKALKKIQNLNSGNKGYTAKKSALIDIPSEIIHNWLGANYDYFIERSPEYLKWRYEDNPVDRNYIVKSFYKGDQFCGFYLLKFKFYPHRKNTKVSHIMEFVYNPQHPGLSHIMLKDIMTESTKNGTDLIHAYSHPEQHDYKLYKKAGFIKFDYKNYIIRVNNPEKYAGIDEPHKWFISLGDSDRA